MKTLSEQLDQESMHDDLRFLQDQIMHGEPNYDAIRNVVIRLNWENSKEFANLMHAVDQLENAMGDMADKCHVAIEKMEANGFVYGKLG